MFSINRLAALGYAALFLVSVAQAQTRPVAPQASAKPVRLPAADIDTGSVAGATTAPAAGAVPAQPAPAAPVSGAAVPAESHLSIDDADKATRSQLLRQLVGGANTPAPTVSASAAQLVPPANPAVAPVHKAAPERARAEPVRFVGAFSDMSGRSVLYEYRNASYPAHVGAKLLNGWTVTRVDGFVVTVAEGTGKGARTWTETIVGGTPQQDQRPPGVGAGISRITDLGGPLPPGTPISAIAQ
jgi:hypothetical protein